jgi:glycerol-3-phosphate dehydrogenase
MRAKAVKFLRESPLDLLVLGGGIVGAGIVRDAAMRGLRVALVEQHDFAFGTSSRSSRLLHGGMRYLAQGRIGLVRESSIEKTIIHHIAPHLAEPLPFVFPAYKGNRNWILWQLKIGVKIYDLLCSGRNLGRSTWLSRNQTLQKVPPLRQDGLKGAVRYFDGLTNDARLVLDTLRSAANHGAALLNYSQFKSASRNEFWQCKIEDLLADEFHSIQARCVVNATGPWADGLPHSQVKLRLTKGIHLVIDRERLPLTDTVVMTEGKRILFAIPWGDRIILGTTDTDYDGSLDDVRVDAADVQYVLQIANQHFPNASLTVSDIISSWAGLRPLIADPHGKPSEISRSHQIDNPEPGWWDVAGGKLTTYRLMAEQTVDQIVNWLNNGEVGRGVLTAPRKSPYDPCRTAIEPLLSPAEINGFSGILPPKFMRHAVAHYCANEWAIHLDDIMLRRTRWHYYSPNAAQMAEQVADWMSQLLGWSEETRRSELKRYFAATNSAEVSEYSGQVAGPKTGTNRRRTDKVHS